MTAAIEDRTTASAEGAIPPPVNTMPTQEEIRAQVRMAERMYGGHRKGLAFVDCYQVEGGIAYRPAGSGDDVDYRWMRDADFIRDYAVWVEFDTEPYEMAMAAMGRNIESLRRTLARSVMEMSNWKSRTMILFSLLGRKGRRKLESMSGDTFAGMVSSAGRAKKDKGKRKDAA
jgi:hypothetical protein